MGFYDKIEMVDDIAADRRNCTYFIDDPLLIYSHEVHDHLAHTLSVRQKEQTQDFQLYIIPCIYAGFYECVGDALAE